MLLLLCSEMDHGRLFMISSDILTVSPNKLEASLIEYTYVVTDEFKGAAKTETLKNRVLSVSSDYTGTCG